MDPQVSIIIVNYKTAALIRNCVDSLREKTKEVSYEIIIVDNSNDNNEWSSLTELTKQFSYIRTINPGRNEGFGRASNYGATIAKGTYLLFLNSDTLLINDAVSILFKTITSDSKIGAIGPNMYDENGKPHHSFVRRETNRSELIFRRSMFSAIQRHFIKNDGFNYTNKPIEISGYLCGACLMVPAELFWNIGPFDPEIFMYSEDNLLCYLLRKNGYKLINNPNAKIIHLEGRSDSSVYSKQKIQNVVFGDYIRQLRAYGFKKAKKFLKTASKVYRRAYLRKKIFHKSGWENDKRLSEEYARFFAEVNSVI